MANGRGREHNKDRAVSNKGSAVSQDNRASRVRQERVARRRVGNKAAGHKPEVNRLTGKADSKVEERRLEASRQTGKAGVKAGNEASEVATGSRLTVET
jgi:hypothetical protein